MRERDARKKVVSAVLEELNECDEEEAAEDELSDVSSKSPYSSHKPTKLQFTFPDKKVGMPVRSPRAFVGVCLCRCVVYATRRAQPSLQDIRAAE